MADRPLSAPLPADLPEDWTTGQTVAPSGADVGLSQQHGYNYLMEQVNAAQRAANAINESFDTISGKRTCRVTVGTSTAGWTQADCDYLCDGTDDQEELNAAIAAVLEKGGGEITVLGGDYYLTEYLWLQNIDTASVSIAGEAGSTVFHMSGTSKSGIRIDGTVVLRFFGITFQPGQADKNTSIIFDSGIIAFDSCTFRNTHIGNPVESKPNTKIMFHNNRVEIDGNFGDNSVLYCGLDYNAQAIISHNTFTATNFANRKLGIISLYNFNYEAANYSNLVFVGNSVETIGSSLNGENFISFSCEGHVLVVGNSFSNCDVSNIRQTLFHGNIITHGSISAATESIVAGNQVIFGSIYAWGDAIVSENFVKASSDKPAIIAHKIANNAQEDISPCIIGNNIAAGSIGVYLRKEDWLSNTSISKALVCSNRIFGCTTPIQIDDNWSECLVTGNLFPAGSSIVNNGRNNIVRLNSDDPGEGGGGGTAGVSSFNGRAGAVTPQNGDYTAEMVGARPDTWTPTAEDVGAVSAGSVSTIQALTQTEYDALTTKNAATLYLIKE